MSPTRSHCENSPSADWNDRQDFQTLLMPYNSYVELREGLRTKAGLEASQPNIPNVKPSYL